MAQTYTHWAKHKSRVRLRTREKKKEKFGRIRTRTRTRKKAKTFKQEKLWRCENIFEYAGEITSRIGDSHNVRK